MKKSKLSILLLVMVMILAISAVSAADTNDTSDSAVQAVDEAPVDEVASADVDAVAATDDADVLSTGGQNFTQLQTDINTATIPYIELQTDYIKKSGEDVVTISRDITINGGYHKIDANNEGGIFKITSGHTITLMNVILVNGNSTEGGAIYNDGSMNLIDATISNCNASNGGAIYNNGILTISGSTLNENTATDGGAVYSCGTLIISGGQTTFEDNVATYNGGAIFVDGGVVSLSNAVLSGNDVVDVSTNDDTGGAAIHAINSQVTLINTNVVNNGRSELDRASGDLVNAVINLMYSNTTITGGLFEGNTGIYGGAINAHGDSTQTLDVTGATFNLNKAYNGAAINIHSMITNIDNCTFTNNWVVGPGSPNYYAAGGAIAADGDGSLDVTDSNFTANEATATGATGGALHVCLNENSVVSIDNCSFSQNTAVANGGAIYSFKNDLLISDSEFADDNDAEVGASIYNEDYLSVYNSTIYSGDSDAVYNKGTLDISSSTLISSGDGNVIYNKGDLSVSDSTLSGSGDGYAIYNDKNLTLSNNTVTDNTLQIYSAKSSKIEGVKAILSVDEENYRINQYITFTAKFVDGNGNPVKTGFTYFCVIGNEKNISIGRSTITYDEATNTYTTTSNYLGQLTSNFPVGTYEVGIRDVTVDEIETVSFNLFRTFTDLEEDIAAKASPNLKGTYTYNSLFDREELKNGIVINKNVTISGSNRIIDGNGEARIFYVNSGFTLTLNNAILMNGVADNGGAIYVESGATLKNGATFKNNAFINNTATLNGGAIYSEGTLNLNNMKFINNTAAGNGASIYSLGTLSLSKNDISTEIAEIYNGGEIASTVNVTTYDAFVSYGEKVNLSATITDDNGNLINDERFYFVVDTVNYEATYNPATKKYELIDQEFNLYVGTYEINVTNTGVDNITYVETGILYATPLKGSFTDLLFQIDNVEDGVLDLPYDFAYVATYDGADLIDGVVITSNLIIKGDYTICGSNAARVFNVTNGATLTLINVTLCHGSADNGGAVYVDADSTLNASYVDFTDNTATYKGGAVYSEGTVNINHALFDANDITVRNNANNGGAAIYSEGTLTINDTTVTNNLLNPTIRVGDTGDNVEAAVASHGETLINNSYFANNSGSHGGAVLFEAEGKKLTVENSIFEGNNATFGAAINAQKGEVEITGSTFNDNHALGNGSGSNVAVGGAISADHTTSLSIIGSNFTGNNATAGGAIYVSRASGDVLIDDCKFENNNASSDSAGGAIVLFISAKSTVSNSEFIANNAGPDYHGGAIFASSTDLDVDTCVFENNTALGYGGAIASFNAELNVIDSNFTGNNATLRGGAIYSENGKLNISYSKFESNKKTKIGSANYAGGAAVYSTSENTVIDNSQFINNINLGSSNGAIYYNKENGILNVTNSAFSGNEILGSSKTGAAIALRYGDLYLNNNTINTNVADVYLMSTARIISYLNITVMENSTYDVTDKSITVTADVVDEMGNKIQLATGSTGVIKYNVIGYKNNNAFKRDATTGLYYNTYTLPNDAPAVYYIGATYTGDTGNAHFYNATVRYIKGTYTDLQNLIGNATGELNLTYDFAYAEAIDGAKFPEGIIINKTLIINGNGSQISGEDTYRIFKVTDGAVVTLNNATLTKGNAVNGGAVYVDADSTLNVNYANFTYNTAVQRGGAIWSAGTVNVDYSSFDSNNITDRRNNVDYGGAAIYNDGTLNVDHSNFTNDLRNYVIRTGDANNPQYVDGIILTSGAAIINNSYFENNSGTYGGAISANPIGSHASASLTVENCEFVNNLAYCGAAIYVGSGSTRFNIKNSTFIGNNATGIGSYGYTSAGGAICLARGADGTITDSRFYNNTATVGGAIDISATKDTVKATIDNCDFENNTAVGSPTREAVGGAIRINPGKSVSGDKVEVAVKNSNFTNNVAPAGGSAIYSNATLTLSGNNVTSGKTEIQVGSKGSIVSEINVVVLEGRNWTTNKYEVKLNATVKDDKGNFIKDGSFNFTIDGNSSIKAVYNDAAQIYEAEYTLSAPGIYLVNVTYPTTNKLSVETYNITCTLGTFTDLQEKIIAAAKAGEDLTLTYNFTYSKDLDGDKFVNGVVVNETVTIKGDGHTISGSNAARIFNITAATTLKNVTLTNGSVADNGGAIYTTAALTVEDSVFDSNKVTQGTNWKPGYPSAGGAAIYAAPGSSLTAIRTNFTNNAALKDTYNRFTSGAIYVVGATGLLIDDCLFENNSAVLGGALTVEDIDQGTVAVNNSVFNNNIAWQGGAINVNEKVGKFIVKGSNFTGNNVSVPNIGDSTPNGGAICIGTTNYGAEVDITGCVFTENVSPNNGGAIWSNNANNDLTVDGCEFITNTASSQGGAIFAAGSTNITGTKFEGNEAKTAGALYVSGSAKVTDSEFISNEATGNGGAIFFYAGPDGSGTLKITDNTNFTENTAGGAGGAILVHNGVVNITDATFKDNTATNTGAAIQVRADAETTIEDSNFTDNGESTDYAVYNLGTLSLKGNRVSNLIYSSAEIKTSTINATLIEGLTIPAELGEVVTPNATLVDDMGNAIYDPNFVITVNGENATEMTYDFTNKIYAGKYTIVKAGENIVSTNYQYATHIETGIYDVDKANVTSFIVDVRDIVDGDNATVAITLVGVNDVGLNATVTVYINNKPITITVENGSGSQIIEDLEPKHYPVVAIFEDIDGNYNTAINSTAFNVKSTQADLSVEIQDSVYGDTITITATLCDDEGNPLTGIVKVSFADNDYYVAVIDGEGSYVVTDKLDVNTYDYVATFESELYNTTTYTDSFDVMQRAVYIYVNNDDGVGVGQVGRIKVVLLDEHNNVIVDEVELIFTDENGDEVNRTVITTSNELWGPVDSRDLEFTKDWSIGTYYVTVVSPNYSFMKLPDEEAPAVYEFTSYADAEGNEVWGTGTVEVIGEAEDGFIPVKVLSNTFDDEFVGKTFYIQEDAEADGTIYQLYIINDDDEYEAIQNVYVSVSEAEPEIWDPVTVEYPVHKNYIEAEVTDGDGEFVYGMEHIVTIELVGYDEDEHRYLVEITCPATVVILKYDEETDQYPPFEERYGQFEDGVLSIDLSDLPVGEYKLMVGIDDKNYQLCTWLYDEVLEEDIQLDYALLYRDDKLFWVNEDNVFLENINGTDWTNYGDGRNFSFELWHEYWMGDNNVRELFVYSTTANVTVYSIERDDEGNIISMAPVHTYESVAITDGISEIIDLSYLNAGEYKVTVALIDDHYVLHGWDGDAPVIYAFTSYDEDGEEWGTGTVQIIGGAEDGFIPVEVLSNSYDDEFVGKIFYIQEDAQEDDLIQLYMMNDNNEIVAVDLWVKVSKQSDEDVDYYCEYFNVDRAGVEVQIYVTDPITYGENETVTITVVTPTGEKLNETVEVNVMGKETFYQTLVNGTVTFNLTGYDVGTYTIWVNFFGTENYAELWNSIAGFTVGKATPQVSVEDVEIPYGNDAVINVAVIGVDDEAVEGTVIVTVNGVEYIVKDGKVTVPAGLASDVYDITARFTGNDNYNEATNDTAKLNITASEVTVVTISVTNVTYGIAPTVTITLKDGEGKDKAGNVMITRGTLGSYLVYVNGIYTESLGLTDVGSYNITASIDGVNDTAFYTVSKSSNATVEVVPNDPSYGEAANITVSAFDGTDPITGNAYVAVDGTPLDGIFPIDGATVIDLGTALTAGVHTIEVEFVNDNYETVNKFTSITVGKATPEIVITDIAGNVGDTVEANVTIAGGDATGYIFYGGEAYIVKDGKATIQVKILTSGIQTITVTYTGDDNYRNGTGNKAFNAGKGTINSISTDIDNNTEYTAGIDLPVEVSVDPAVSGEYTVWIDGVEATDYGPFTVENGQGSFIILAEDLPAGEHNITVQFKEDTFYHASENVTYVFSVVKSDISIETDIVNGTEFTAGDNVNVAVDVTPAVSGTYTLWIDGKPVSDYGTLTVYNGEGGFTILAEDLTAGEHNITVQFNENELYYASENATYVFSVVKSDVSIETDIVNGTEFTAGEDLNVAVDVTPAVSGEYTLWIDGKPVSDYGILTVYNGEGSFIILAEDLTVGKHNITVQFNENELYHASENVTYVFNVVTSTSISTDIVNGTTVAAGEDLTVNVSVDPAVNGTYTLWIDGVEATDYLSLNVNNGKGGFIILAKDVTAGYHTVSVQFNGDELYKQSEKVTYAFTAAKKDSIIKITTGDVVIDTPLDVTINIGNLTGDVTVTGGAYEGTVTLNNGEGTFTIPKENMTAGPKTIVVIVSDNAQYADNSSSYTFTVEKAENYTFEVNITVSEITVADDVTFNVTLPGDANGIVYVSVDGTPVTFEPVVNGNATVTIPASAFTGGRNNTIEVTYEDSGDKYANATVTKEIYVSKLPYELTATAKNVELGQNVTIVVKLPEGADGRAYASLQGNIYFADGDVITIENLTEGSYTAYVVFIYDSRYEDNQTKVEFNVTKVSVPADVAFSVNTPENATAPEVTVTLPEDATGFLLVDVDGAQTFVPLVNGTATARIPDGLAAGNYTAEITYTGDNKYAPITTTKEITVASNVPDNAFTIPENSTTDSPTYSISLPGDAGGYLEVDVDGTKYIAPLVNGSASITVPGLSEGKHNVTVTYSGDGKYSKVVKSNTLDVKLPVPVYKITNNKDVKVIYSAKATYKVLVTKDGKAVGAGESVVITFNGKKYTVKTDKNGYATLNLNTKVKVKTYTVTAEYNGVKVTNKVKVQHVIKASNKKVKKSRKVTKVKITLKKVNGKVLKKKTLKIKFRGKTYKVKTNKKGVAYWKVKKSMLKRTTVGKKYKYRITYGKDVLTKRLIVKR